jgi:hypothetical protein
MGHSDHCFFAMQNLNSKFSESIKVQNLKIGSWHHDSIVNDLVKENLRFIWAKKFPIKFSKIIDLTHGTLLTGHAIICFI